MSTPLLVIDVGHPPRHPERVEEELLAALIQVRASASLRVLKIIHGHGSSGKGGTTKETVRNWAFRNRRRIRAIIPGEAYDLSDATTQELRKTSGAYDDRDLGAANAGVTYLWVR